MKAKMLMRWRDLFERIGAKGNPDEIYHRLVYYYMQPCRPYHNLSHISDCLKNLDEVRTSCSNPDQIELALWFHDAIYESWSNDNEYRSGLLANFFITKLMELDPSLGTRVHQLIITTTHIWPPKTFGKDEGVMVDIDLVPLGAYQSQFELNSKKIRTEYQWVQPESRYRKERANILEKFLKRSFIYYTWHFREKYEAQARNNLEREIERLRIA